MRKFTVHTSLHATQSAQNLHIWLFPFPAALGQSVLSLMTTMLIMTNLQQFEQRF